MPRAIPYAAAARLFPKVEDWDGASQRVEESAEAIEKMEMRMEDGWKEINKSKSYAHVVGGQTAVVTQAIRAGDQSMATPEGKRIMVRLPDTITAETIKEQSREEIIERIRGIAA